MAPRATTPPRSGCETGSCSAPSSRTRSRWRTPRRRFSRAFERRKRLAAWTCPSSASPRRRRPRRGRRRRSSGSRRTRGRTWARTWRRGSGRRISCTRRGSTTSGSWARRARSRTRTRRNRRRAPTAARRSLRSSVVFESIEFYNTRERTRTHPSFSPATVPTTFSTCSARRTRRPCPSNRRYPTPCRCAASQTPARRAASLR
mmetsp:Transcript_3422/g.11572  ORF Transcript_3422/g.11572 Transcript_3422/m.11572 type:complete len:203 (-) Transcript_3422:745-1353(-)